MVVIWLVQFLTVMGFSFAIPFAPFYIQELKPSKFLPLDIWVALFGACAYLSMALFSPVWGAVGDRFGRRLMLIRANFGGALILILMSFAPSVGFLICLRTMQGVFSGVYPAAQTLISIYTPLERRGLALGALSAALYGGMLSGVTIGGFCADAFGYRAAFLIAGGIVFTGFLAAFFGTRENFTKPEAVSMKPKMRLPSFGSAWMILGLIGAIAATRLLGHNFLPLLVEEIHGGVAGAATWTGLLSGTCCVAGVLAGVIIGHLADRISPPKIGMVTALLAGIMMLPQGLAQSFAVLFPARAGMVFFAGGLEPVFQIWLAKSTPESQRGAVFGWAASAKYVGWALAAIVSGVVATVFGVRWIYLLAIAPFLALIPLIYLTVRKIKENDERCR